jgi:hypothetical protein
MIMVARSRNVSKPLYRLLFENMFNAGHQEGYITFNLLLLFKRFTMKHSAQNRQSSSKRRLSVQVDAFVGLNDLLYSLTEQRITLRHAA